MPSSRSADLQEAEGVSGARGLPDRVLGLLRTSSLGYLSVLSKKGDLYSYPVAFHYSDLKVYFITPIGSAKMKFLRANPSVSFIVDNKKLTSPTDPTAACGAMFQGRARIFNLVRLVTSLVSMGPMAQIAKKYPGMFSFYLKGKELPEERKFYKYRLIRIDPAKIVYWTGYDFGRYIPEAGKRQKGAAVSASGLDELKRDESKVEGIAGLLKNAADEELEVDQVPVDDDWLSVLKEAVASGVVDEGERAILATYRSGAAAPGGRVTSDEKTLLKKWRASS